MVAKKESIINKPVLSVDLERLEKTGVSLKELGSYLPRYVLNPTPLNCERVKEIWFSVLHWFFGRLVRIFFQLHQTPAGIPDSSEVNEVYTKVAVSYDHKHHLMTRGMDWVWRRTAGWFVAAIGRNSRGGNLKVLDLCTGTGLVIKEMVPILAEWGIEAEIIGLDYNPKMLGVAEENIGTTNKIRFVRGDAMNVDRDFDPNSIDAVTLIAGIGGIPAPLKVFDGVLRILKPGGQFLMIDSHKPIPSQSGEWPLFFRWRRFPIFEMRVYERLTIPLILRSWGWRDPTPSFYLLPLITYQESNRQYWGFKVQSFEQETQRWWLGLPSIPIGKIIVEKVKIDEKTAKMRKTILGACSFP